MKKVFKGLLCLALAVSSLVAQNANTKDKKTSPDRLTAAD